MIIICLGKASRQAISVILNPGRKELNSTKSYMFSCWVYFTVEVKLHAFHAMVHTYTVW